MVKPKTIKTTSDFTLNASQASPYVLYNSASVNASLPAAVTQTSGNQYPSYVPAPVGQLYNANTGCIDYGDTEQVRAKLREFTSMAYNADYTGMPNEEIYMSVFNRNTEAFGLSYPASLMI